MKHNRTWTSRLVALVLTIAVIFTLIVPAAAQTVEALVWKDEFLNGPTTTFNFDLALFCHDLIQADNDPNGEVFTGSVTGEQVKGALQNAGFQVLQQKNYNKADQTSQQHNTAYTIAKRTTKANGKDVTLYVAVISPCTIGEFVGNFDFASDNPDVTTPSRDYNTNVAKSFTMTAKDVYNSLVKLVGTQTENIRFLVTGESRGGGAANYLGKLLNDTYGYEKVQAYSFSTPNVAKLADKDDGNSFYNNIFNIVNPEDLVTYLPMENTFGFEKYGQTLLINTNNLAAKAAVNYKVYTGQEFYPNDKSDYTSKTAVSLTDTLLNLSNKSVRGYYEDRKDAFIDYTCTNMMNQAKSTNKMVQYSVFEFVGYVFGLFEMVQGIELETIDASNYKEYAELICQVRELHKEIKDIEDNNRPYKPILQYFLKYGLGYENIDALLKGMGLYDLVTSNGLFAFLSAIKGLGNLSIELYAREAIVSHRAECYRAYMDAAGSAQNLFTNQPAVGFHQISDENGNAALEAAGTFFKDMYISCSVAVPQASDGIAGATAQWQYDLGLNLKVETTAGTKAINPNGPVMVTLTVPEEGLDLTKFKLYRAGTSEEIQFSITDGKICFITDKLGSFYLWTDQSLSRYTLESYEDNMATGLLMNKDAETVLAFLCGYDANGKATEVFVYEVESGKSQDVTAGFPEETTRVCLMVTDKDRVPLMDVQEK